MNCREFRELADYEFRQTGGDISADLKTHAKSCDQCSSYLNNLALLNSVLNEPRLMVRPGELDDITFDNIVSIASGKTIERQTVRIARPIKWILAPMAVAAAAILIFMLAKPGQKADNSYAGIGPYSSVEIVNTILSSDSAGVGLLSSLLDNDTGLDPISDELMKDSEIDDLLSGMTAGELKNLYDKIDNLKG